MTEAVPEAIEASLHISEAALIAAGVPLGLAIAAIHEERDQYRAAYQRIAPQERDPVARLRTRRSALRKGEHEAAAGVPPARAAADHAGFALRSLPDTQRMPG